MTLVSNVNFIYLELYKKFVSKFYIKKMSPTPTTAKVREALEF